MFHLAPSPGSFPKPAADQSGGFGVPATRHLVTSGRDVVVFRAFTLGILRGRNLVTTYRARALHGRPCADRARDRRRAAGVVGAVTMASPA